DCITSQRVAYGTVSKPNSSFARRVSSVGFNPVGRWKQSFSSAELTRFERILGNTLQEFGYSPVTDGPGMGESLANRSVRLLHRTYFAAKLWGKNNSILRAIRPTITSAELDEIVHADTHSPLP